MINYEEFKNVEMRVGKILEVEIVPDADKLYKFKVDFGNEVRQILSAIRESYPEPDYFLNRKLTFVTNLETRKIRGFESQGMVLAVDGREGQPVFLIPEEDVDPGSNVR